MLGVMAAVISMLRGINLGKRRVKMEALRELYESLDLEEPQTYIQSGNVVFQTKERDLVRLAGRVESAIERKFGFHSDVIMRTAAELREVIARNPFAAREDVEPGKLLVTFLASDPGQAARDKVLGIQAEPEELRIDGREVYIYFPNGMARPKLSMPAVERALKVAGTGRNWNSVLKLLAMAEGLE
jgi:uncharacterized protein (DUF1697 family)